MDMLSKRKQAGIDRMMREYRMENKAAENQGKPAVSSPDIQKTSDFTFGKMPLDRVGDSGVLLLAKRKTDRSERYVVKHEFCDCAANEFVYAKLCHAIEIKTPEVKLFQLTDGDKRTCFRSEYIMGSRFVGDAIASPSYDDIMEKAQNWQDFFRCIAMEKMCLEGDSTEYLLTSDGYLYRIDASDSFGLWEDFFASAGIDRIIIGKNPKENALKHLAKRDYDAIWQNAAIDFDIMASCIEARYGRDYIPIYQEPFHRIQEISPGYIDDFLDTLCYIYPDMFGYHYKASIQALQKAARQYLRSKQ